MRRVSQALVGAGIVAAVLVPTAALAQASPSTVHSTTSGREPGPNPCTGASGVFIFDADEVMHTTADGHGRYHFSLTARSDDQFAPDDRTQPTYTGGDTLHIDEQDVGGRSTSTYVQVGRVSAPDGSSVTFRSLYHVTIAADGTPIASRSVDTVQCG